MNERPKQGGFRDVVKPSREAKCQYCGVSFSSAAISKPCKPGHVHRFQMYAS